jgi:hypothetical protein
LPLSGQIGAYLAFFFIDNSAFAFNQLISVGFEGSILSGRFDIGAFGNDDSNIGDLRSKFYAEDPANGTPGWYTSPDSSSKMWTRR